MGAGGMRSQYGNGAAVRTSEGEMLGWNGGGGEGDVVGNNGTVPVRGQGGH